MSSANNSSIARNFTFSNCVPYSFLPTSYYDIYKCYAFFAGQAILLTILEIGLGVISVLANGFVFWLIIKGRSQDSNRNRFIFDKILLAHAVVDFITASVDMPFYHINTIFGYWPFNQAFCIFWSTLDNAVNMVSILHVLFLSLVQLISIVKPQNFNEYFLVKRSYLVSIGIWFVGLTVWGCINGIYVSGNWRVGTCSIPKNPYYVKLIMMLLTMFIPLCIVAGLSIYIVRTLSSRKKIKVSVSALTNANSSNNYLNQTNKSITFRLTPQTKFTIINIIFLVQWLPISLIWITDSLCSCVPSSATSAIYWISFTVTLTDPLLIILLNSNYQFLFKLKRQSQVSNQSSVK